METREYSVPITTGPYRGRSVVFKGPVGMSDQQVQAIADRELKRVLSDRMYQDEMRPRPAPNPAEGINPLEAGTIGAGRALSNMKNLIMGGQDPAQAQNDDRQYNALAQQNPVATTIGEGVGYSLPFAPMATAVGAASLGGPVTTMLARTALSGAVGAAEGATISVAEGETDAGEIAKAAALGALITGGFEAVFPILGAIVNGLAQRIGKSPIPESDLFQNGRPTEKLQSILDEAGTDIESVSVEALNRAMQNGSVSPEDVIRQQRFLDMGVPHTRGDVTQDFGDQAAEAVLEKSDTPAGATYRAFRASQSEALKDRVQSLVDQMGFPDDVGMSIKEGLLGYRDVLTDRKNMYYGEAAKMQEEFADIPIFTNKLQEAMPRFVDLDDMGNVEGSQINAVRKALVRYGLDQREPAVKEFEANWRNRVRRLTVGNLESLRKDLLAAMRNDKTGESTRAVGDLVKAIDEEYEIIGESLRMAGVPEDGILKNVLADARSTYKELKTTFSPDTLTGKLTSVRGDGFTPTIEASQAYSQMMRNGTPVEQFVRTLETLTRTPQGAQAINNMRARTLNDALEAAFTRSRKYQGTEIINGNQFDRHLAKIGDEKLRALFPGEEFARLQNMRAVMKDMTPTAGARPVGSASTPWFIGAVHSTLGAIPTPMNQAMLQVLRQADQAKGDEELLMRALDGQPRLVEALNYFKRNYPKMTEVLVYGARGAATPAVAAQTLEDEEN